jgi:glycosyltransferase involved in cell wall biosynthesis
MKLLFVVSGNVKPFSITPFVKAQGDALIERGVQLSYFRIEGRGLKNYCKSIYYLRKHVEKNRVDLIHAHYSLCGWVAVLARRKTPVVLSLMGDDAQGAFTGEKKIKFSSRFFMLLTRLVQPFVKAIISKSQGLEKIVYRKKISYVIPNGVQLNKFIASESGFRSGLGLKKDLKYILFLGNPMDINKNYALARDAVRLLNRSDVELINVFNASHESVIEYLNSVDVFVSCSFAEGSANVIKEAMACNCPMVVTNAGDAEWVIGNEPGCFISSYVPQQFAMDITLALNYSQNHQRTNGRKRICDLGLDSDSVTEKLMQVYRTVLNNQ